jgi:hypothetical protein
MSAQRYENRAGLSRRYDIAGDHFRIRPIEEISYSEIGVDRLERPGQRKVRQSVATQDDAGLIER